MDTDLQSDPATVSDKDKFYVWTFPGSPIAIHIALDVIWRLNLELDLELELDRNTGAVHGAKAPDAYGLLLGSVQSGSAGPSRITITDYTAFTEGTASLDDELALAAGSAIGIFRTQPENRPFVRECDRPLLRADQHPVLQVVLLIACGQPGNRTAGFLFREGDVIHPFSFLDFEFDAVIRNEPKFFYAEEEPAAAEVAAPPQPAAEVASLASSPARVRRSSFFVMLACLAGIIAGALGTAGVWLVLTAWQAVPLLHLTASAVDGGAMLTWNPPSSSVPVAGGRLIVDTRPNSSVIQLDSDQIRAGKLFYGPILAKTRFYLEVRSATETLDTDSILVIIAPPKP